MSRVHPILHRDHWLRAVMTLLYIRVKCPVVVSLLSVFFCLQDMEELNDLVHHFADVVTVSLPLFFFSCLFSFLQDMKELNDLVHHFSDVVKVSLPFFLNLFFLQLKKCLVKHFLSTLQYYNRCVHFICVVVSVHPDIVKLFKSYLLVNRVPCEAAEEFSA